jgi:hypothetical protein
MERRSFPVDDAMHQTHSYQTRDLSVQHVIPGCSLSQLQLLRKKYQKKTKIAYVVYKSLLVDGSSAKDMRRKTPKYLWNIEIRIMSLWHSLGSFSTRCARVLSVPRKIATKISVGESQISVILSK